MAYYYSSGFPDEGPPTDFQISSSSDSDVETYQFEAFQASYEEGGQKCPLCCRVKDRFTCKECLLRGEFSHSSPVGGKLRERYCELKLRLVALEQKRNEVVSKCSVYTNKREHIANIVNHIESYQSTIALQKELKKQLEKKIAEDNRQAEAIRKITIKKTQNWPEYRSRLDFMATQYRHNIARVNNYRENVEKHKEHLQRVTKERILQLKEYVFPIQQISSPTRDLVLLNSLDPQVPSRNQSSRDLWDEEEDDDTVAALMAATSHYGEKSDSESLSSFGMCHSIPGPHGPTLPASGDYAAYVEWTDKGQGLATGQGATRNPAHCIGAALTYTTQFVNLVAYYLDLRLPHRLSYSEFTNGDLMGVKFNRKVAKLNANVIHLCASQGIPPNFIQPRRTIPNLLLLFDDALSELGRRGPFEVATQLAKSMEESIEKDLVIYEEDSSESEADWSDSNFPSDWENVQRGTITEEMSAQNMTAHNNQSYFQSMSPSSPTHYQSESFTRSRASVSGGLMSSVISFFKGGNS